MVKGRERKTGYEKAPRPILIAASPKNRPAESARSIGVIVVSARSDEPERQVFWRKMRIADIPVAILRPDFGRVSFRRSIPKSYHSLGSPPTVVLCFFPNFAHRPLHDAVDFTRVGSLSKINLHFQWKLRSQSRAWHRKNVELVP